MLQLEEMAARKEAAAMERERRNLEKQATKDVRAREKDEKLKVKLARAETNRAKKNFKEQWSAKNLKAAGDRLHNAIRASASTVPSAPPRSTFVAEVCRNNRKLAIARGRAKKRGEDPRSVPTLQELWPQLRTAETQEASQHRMSAFYPITRIGSLQNPNSLHALTTSNPGSYFVPVQHLRK